MEENEGYVAQEITAPVLTGTLPRALTIASYCASERVVPYCANCLCSGFPLKLALWLLEGPLAGPVRTNLLRKNRMIQILEEHTFTESPLYTPNTVGWPKEQDHMQHMIPDDAPPVDAAHAAVKALGIDMESSKAPCTVLDYHRAYLAVKTTPTEVAQRAIDAIAASEALSPPMRIFICHDPKSVLAQTAASTARYASGKPLSVFDGAPFAVKDEVDVAPYPTSAGTSFIANVRPIEGTLPGASALQDAGAILLGKTNMHEIGLGTTGLNPRRGTPRNPYDACRHTGGSSSGSAAAVAAGLCFGAVGMDGGGSIRIPAALCGCVGLKPTHDRVCTRPGPEIAHTVGVGGPIASTVRDCALMYALLANRGHLDVDLPSPEALALPNLEPRCLSSKPLQGLRVGIYSQWFQHAEPSIVEACTKAVAILSNTGAEVVEIVVPCLKEVELAHGATIMSEMRSCMSGYLQDPLFRTQFNAETRLSLAVARGVTATAYVNAQKIRRRATAAMRQVFDVCDVIATPAVPVVAPYVIPGSTTGGASDLRTTSRLMRFCQLANLIGLPAIVLPIGGALEEKPCAKGKHGVTLPVGLQLIGKPWHEATLLHAAAVLEDRVGREVPTPAIRWNLLGPYTSTEGTAEEI